MTVASNDTFQISPMKSIICAFCLLKYDIKDIYVKLSTTNAPCLSTSPPRPPYGRVQGVSAQSLGGVDPGDAHPILVPLLRGRRPGVRQLVRLPQRASVPGRHLPPGTGAAAWGRSPGRG